MSNLSPGSSPPLQSGYRKGDWIRQTYKVVGLLGRGGFGVVYLVIKPETKAVYALKTFLDEFMGNPVVRESFRREAQVWVNLDRHPYLVRANYVDNLDSRLFLAMEFIAPDENGLNSLARYLKKQPPDLAQTLRWAIQFCHGMEHAYAHGIRSHRDIKPANILIDRNKDVKISDFGLARAIDSAKSKEPGAGGTPTHMPPEQFLNSDLCDQRSDLYSFGVVLYEMVSEKLPFLASLPKNGSANELAAFYQGMFRLHASADPAGLDSPLNGMIRRCLEKKPKDRFQTFAELRSELEPLLLNLYGETIVPPTVQDMQVWDWNNKGMSYDQLGMHAEAVECFDQALALDPQSAPIWCNKGNNLKEQGRFPEAVAAFDKALELEPRSARTWNNKGTALLTAHLLEDAIACFERALEINPEYAIAWHNRGFALTLLGRFEEAIRCYDGAIALHPRSVFSWFQKGNALQNLEQDSEAGKCFAQAAAIDPDYARQALRLFDHDLDADPCNVWAWFQKAQAEERLSLREKAVDSYRHYLELAGDSQSPLPAVARARIQLLKK